MFLLIDCNNFFVSCERVFQPNLQKKPVVVLSNNDGCIISRSNEAKALNILMGSPIFNYKNLLDTGKLIALSGNFTLYADFSFRIQTILESFDRPLEIYSIDEAFIQVDDLEEEDLLILAKNIREKILNWTGITVSIGISKTKTLAKVANRIAKKSQSGIFSLIDKKTIDETLCYFKVEDIWGIGRSLSQKLISFGIKTAKNLIDQNDDFIKKELTITGFRTKLELLGNSCDFLKNEIPLQKSLLKSRSFSPPISQYETLRKIVFSFLVDSLKKLKAESRVAQNISLFLTFGTYKKNETFSFHEPLPIATSFPGDFSHFLETALKKIFKPRTLCRRAGILLTNLQKEENFPLDFFHLLKNPDKKEKVLKTMNLIQKRFGENSIYFAEEKSFFQKMPLNISKHYTTSWDDILSV